jgi:hypothetical protein
VISLSPQETPETKQGIFHTIDRAFPTWAIAVGLLPFAAGAFRVSTGHPVPTEVMNVTAIPLAYSIIGILEKTIGAMADVQETPHS